jgi:hypothetical protein
MQHQVRQEVLEAWLVETRNRLFALKQAKGAKQMDLKGLARHHLHPSEGRGFNPDRAAHPPFPLSRR